MGLDTDNVDAGGEGGDVEVGGVVEGGHLATVHVHDQHLDNLVVSTNDVDLASSWIRHELRVGAVNEYISIFVRRTISGRFVKTGFWYYFIKGNAIIPNA